MGNESCTEIINHERGEGDPKPGPEIERSLEIGTVGNNSSGPNIRKKEPTSVTHQDKIRIRRLQSTSVLRTQCFVDGVSTVAVVDTAADVTIISEQLFEKLSPRPNCLREIKMYAAGKDQTLTAKAKCVSACGQNI